MSKIVRAVNVMVSNPEQITNVISSNYSDELFFIYKNKYKWGMKRDEDGEYYLYYYPGRQTLNQLAGFSDQDWNDFSEMVVYSTNGIGTKEARSSFADLYTVVREKRFGLNDVLDDIIGDEVPF